ncbi:MAG: UDP-galactopyranose mutase [Bacteroidales bacterium]|nr:UDP-galactopyranose mutase [Bacteroidales bacterium]
MERSKYDCLIVGSGLYGAVSAWKARREGRSCLVIDRRPQLGGNLYCQKTEGIEVHSYGPHIFHTSNRKVWDFVNSLTPFNGFINSPLANYNGELYSLPFNMNTFRQMWGISTPEEAKAIIEEQRKEISCEPSNLEEQAISLVGRNIYEKLIKEYTQKQWGRECKDLPAFIIKRLPVRFEYNNNYYDDTYQGVPVKGYNALIEALLEGVETVTGADFFANRSYWESLAERIIFTGRIDEYFDFCFGRLDYRTVTFETETLDIPDFQGNAVVNYTSKAQPFTRITEHKHFYLFGDEVKFNPKTVISREYPCEWSEGREPFYPVNDIRNTAVYGKYRELALSQNKVVFGGRLAEYRYYDMAPIIEKVLDLK